MMKPALAFQEPNQPKSWASLPNGSVLLNAIEQHLQEWSAKFFGYHLLKIGALSAQIQLANCTIKHQTVVAPEGQHVNVIADIDDLPVLEHSVDVCVLSHALEFSVDPHHVVREANRVLIPNGYMVITGFNPFSLAGLNKLIPYRRTKFPWRERFFSPMRVKDWLQLMGYEILQDSRCFHSMLASNYKTSYFSEKCRQFGAKYLSQFGSIYIIVAKKRVLPLTPVKPKWRIRPQFTPVNASTRQSN